MSQRRLHSGIQRHSSLEKHLTFGKCTKSVERETLIDKAVIKYAATLQEDERALPTISATIFTAADRSVAPPEGWALRKTKKEYRFNEEQRRYLEARFNIGQESGMKLDSEVVAKEMRRARGSCGERLFRVLEFLTTQQVASFFSWMAAKTKQQTIPGATTSDPDISAMEDEENFSKAKEAVMDALHVQHPISYDQYSMLPSFRTGPVFAQKELYLIIFVGHLNIRQPKNSKSKRNISAMNCRFCRAF